MERAAPILKTAAPSRFEQSVTATILPAKVLTPQLHNAIGSHSSTAMTAAHSVAHRESMGAGTAGLAADLGEQSAMPIAEPMIAEAALPEKSSTEATAPAPRTRTLSVTPDEHWVDQLGRDIASLATSSGTILFRLKPEQLGQITVALDLIGDQLSVHLHSGSADISAVLQGAQTRLAEELRAQGLTLSALDTGPHQGRTGSEGSPRGSQLAQATDDQATGEPPSLPSQPTEPPNIRLA
jgi:flagellar hook-length control protein FliK